VISIFRLCSAKYPASSGIGAANNGGRWNPIGVPVIYASQSASLAALEILVHFGVLPRDYALTEIKVPANLLIVRLELVDLPADWDAPRPTAASQQIGELWVRKGRGSILSVPSSIVPTERNFILNPAHAAFRRLKFLPSVPFTFDPRLK
jgi:RES domain-containing protein